MKKLNPFLFVAILLSPFSLSAQGFPLLNNVYSPNCSDKTLTSTYYQKDNEGEIVKYISKFKENAFTYTKLIVKKYSVDGDKVSIELIDARNQSMLRETLELKPDGKAIRIFNLTLGGKEYVKNGKSVSDESREQGFQALCEPNSEVSILVKSNLQPPTVKTEAPATVKKLASEKCYVMIQGDQTIDSCDANVIKNSLAGYNRALLWKFKNDSTIEQTMIISNGGAKVHADATGGAILKQIESSTRNYKLSGNLITLETPNGSGCFVTNIVEEKNGYRKEYFKSASPACSQAIVKASEISTRRLKSGEDKGMRIISN